VVSKPQEKKKTADACALGAVKSHRPDDDGLVVEFDNAVARVSAPAPGVIRFRAAPGGEFDKDVSFAVVEQEESPGFEVSEEGDFIRFKTDGAVLALWKNPFRLEFLDNEDRPYVVKRPEDEAGFRDGKPFFVMAAPPEEMYLGLGEKTGGLDKRGRKWKMWGVDRPYSTKADPLYQSVPVLIGYRNGRAWAAFFDNTWKSFFDMCASRPDSWEWSAAGGEINVYFIAGPTLPELTRRYMRLVGGIPMPPKWALGYHQSRYSYETAAEVRRVARTFRELAIPCDAIHLDIHYMRGYRVFTFDEKGFPDPKGLAEDLKKSGFKLVCIADPGVKEDYGWEVFKEGLRKGCFCKNGRGETVIKYCWPLRAAWPDFCREEVRRWWGGLHEVYADAGIEGVWNDMNEPSMWTWAFHFWKMAIPTGMYYGEDMFHAPDDKPAPHLKYRNVYGMLENKATREGLLRLRPGRRPFVLTRAGFAGVGRYAIMWTGDNFSTWAHLAMTVPMLINLGLTGQPICGPDTGGFVLNAGRELFARWMQLGAFYPYFRGHTAVHSLRHEPWTFGKKVEEICRRFIGLRYRLMPYLYSLVWEAHREGDPLWRPLAYHFPEDEKAARVEDQVMVGPHMMVAPVTKRRARSREVYLPAGRWLEFFSGKEYEGPGTRRVGAPFERIPVFLREGAVIPMGPPMQYTDEKAPDPLTLEIFPGKGAFRLWEDDGVSMDYERGAFACTPVSTEKTAEALLVKIGPREGIFHVPERKVKVKIRGADRPASITLNGEPVPSDSWKYDKGCIDVKFSHDGREVELALIPAQDFSGGITVFGVEGERKGL